VARLDRAVLVGHRDKPRLRSAASASQRALPE
jgi:hypothetical protein